MNIKYLLLLSTILLVNSLTNIKNIYDLKSRVETNEWTFLKVYSKDCGYCKQIQPTCIQLEKENQNVTFLQLIGPEQQQFALKYKITIFPTLFLYHKYLDLPIMHHGARDKQNLQGWINYMINFKLPTRDELKVIPDVIYKGPRGNQYELVKLLALRQIYTVFAWQQSQQTPVLSINGQNFTKFNSQLELQILRSNAKFQNFTEHVWYNMHIKKMNSVIFVNSNSTNIFYHIFNKLAQANPDIVFAQIEKNHPQYQDLLQYLSAKPETGVYAVNPARAGLFKLDKQITEQALMAFVKGLRSQTLEVHKKSQQSDNPHILTLANQHLVAQIPKDVVLFLYDDKKPYASKLIQLVNYVIAYLKPNKNIHVFLCNPLKNDLTIQVPVDPLPMIIFFKNQMKQHHIYFGEQDMNPNTVIDFVKQNTTFDWVDPEDYEQSEEVKNDQGQEL